MITNFKQEQLVKDIKKVIEISQLNINKRDGSIESTYPYNWGFLKSHLEYIIRQLE